jgi:hypothetical protein
VIAVVAVLVVATVAVLVAWGFRVISDIEDLENLSARVVGPAGEIGSSWAVAGNEGPVSRHVRIHPVRLPSAAMDAEATPAAS